MRFKRGLKFLSSFKIVAIFPKIVFQGYAWKAWANGVNTYC